MRHNSKRYATAAGGIYHTVYTLVDTIHIGKRQDRNSSVKLTESYLENCASHIYCTYVLMTDR
jgi:hypothetical protein